MTQFFLHLAMGERDTDIEFDFFDEPETQEAPRRERPRQGPPRPPVRPPAGLTPLLRLVGLVAFAILIVILLVVAIQSCQASGERSKYEHYMKRVSDIAADSESIGRDLTTALTASALKEPALERRLFSALPLRRADGERHRKLLLEEEDAAPERP